MIRSLSLGLLAGLLLSSAPPTHGLPLDGAQSPAVKPKVEWGQSYTIRLPPILRRDGIEPVCDRTCTYHLLFQTAYTSASMGIEYAMATYKAQDFCYEEQKEWCPQIVDSKTTAIASRSSYMVLDYETCDEPCLLVAMAEVSRRGALYAMQWAHQMFRPENGTLSQHAIQELYRSMWILSEHYASASGGALHGGHSQGWNTTVTNTTSSGNSSAPINETSTVTTHPATNLLAPYIVGGKCYDTYLCHPDNFERISKVLKKAETSSVKGATWLGFMLHAARTEHLGKRPTFPKYVAEVPSPDVGHPRPPSEWTPERIPEAPMNPDAPEVPPQNPTPKPDDDDVHKPTPEEEREDEKRRKESNKPQAEAICKTAPNPKTCEEHELRKEEDRYQKQKEHEAGEDKKADDARKKADDEQRKLNDEREKQDEADVAKACPDPNNNECPKKEWEKIDEKHQVEDEQKMQQDNKKQDQQTAEEVCSIQPEPVKKECADNEMKKSEDDRQTQKESNQKADQAREKQEVDGRDKKCESDPVCHEHERANAEARKKFDEQQKWGKKQKAQGKKPANLRQPPEKPEAGPSRPRPRPETQLEPGRRYISQNYDRETGTLQKSEVEDLVYDPMELQRRYRELGMPSQHIDQFSTDDYKPFNPMKDGKRVGRDRWFRFDELIPLNDPAWNDGVSHKFKEKEGKVVTDAMGDPLLTGPDGSAPRTLQPQKPKKSVRFDHRVRYKWTVADPRDGMGISGGHDGEDLIDFDSRTAASHDLTSITAADYANGKLQAEEPDNDLDIDWDPKDKQVVKIPPESHQLSDGTYSFWENSDGPGGGSGTSLKPKPKPGQLGPSRFDGPDDSPDVKKIKKVKLPKGFKLSTTTKLLELWLSPSLLSPAGWILAIVGIEAEEIFFMGLAKGNEEVYWDCLKSRYNPFMPDYCSAVDADGNQLAVEDRGPFRNFVENMLGWAKDKDIDGDGDLENLWERMIASMEDTGHAVHDFLDDSDGTGWKENGQEFVLNIATTMGNVIEKVGEKIAEWKPVKVIVKAGKKIWNWFTGDDDDDDD